MDYRKREKRRSWRWDKFVRNEEPKMNSENSLKMKFRKVDRLPEIQNGTRCGESLNQMKQVMFGLNVGEIIHIPVMELFPEYDKKKWRSICVQYKTKGQTALRHLRRLNPEVNFQFAVRDNELYIRRVA